MRVWKVLDDLLFGIIKASIAYIDPGTAMLLAAGIGAGGSLLGGVLGDDDEPEYRQQPTTFTKPPTPEWVQGPDIELAPEYPQSKWARETMGGMLMDWKDLPGYGAVSPDWADIWNQAKSQVQRYFWGGPEGEGVAGKVKASAARRNVSESPALTAGLTRLAKDEANILGDIASEQAIKKAEFSEQGRQNWLNALMRLSGMSPGYYTPSGTWSTAVPSTGQYYTPSQSGTGSAVANLGSTIGKAIMQQQQNAWYEDLLKNMSPQTADVSGMGQVPVAPDNFYLQ